MVMVLMQQKRDSAGAAGDATAAMTQHKAPRPTPPPPLPLPPFTPVPPGIRGTRPHSPKGAHERLTWSCASSQRWEEEEESRISRGPGLSFPLNEIRVAWEE